MEGPTAFIIDDEITIREILAGELQDIGYNVLTGANGLDAINMIDAHGIPKLIVIDLFMPEKEGIETILEIRRDFPTVKIIAISGGDGRHNTNFLDFARKLGADAVFYKPIDLDQFTRTAKLLGNN